MAKDPNVLEFKSENPYMAENNEQAVDLLAKAKELVEQGKMQEAMLCLEAEVQKNV